ncbi:MAG: Gfo/Idh/MocA family oxidoreductase [bacterium]|nr:Gfo/Idh/MocA family oxidoreductase [bacterium]
MNRVKIGIIGCGVIGRHHAAAAAACPHIDLVAVADLINDRAQAMAGQHGIPKIYGEGADLIDDRQVDGVVLAFPAVGRFDMALRAFRNGLHVLTEKPAAMHADQVRQLITARGDLIAGCCSARYRFLESSEAITRFVAEGHLGALRSIHCRAIRPGGPPPENPPPIWRLRTDLNGGGIMSNWGCYDLDYLLGLTGWTVQPETVLARTWTVPPAFAASADPSSDAETHVCATIQCGHGIAIHYERGEMVAAAQSLSWDLVGTDGSLDLHMTDRSRAVTFRRACARTGLESRVIWDRDEGSVAVHHGPVQDFALAIREGRSPKTSLGQAFVVQAITDAIYASAASGSAVSVARL